MKLAEQQFRKLAGGLRRLNMKGEISMKERLYGYIDNIGEEMFKMADQIFDHPELGLEEVNACKWLTDWLEKDGFEVERGIAGVETSFRAIYRHGEGGPNIGLLCEYDALPQIGHACGHHMQGPCILASAAALRHSGIEGNYTITVYGTPAEESVSGKIMMIKGGCTFEELDVALMMHGGNYTQTDVKSLALSKFRVEYQGISAHAALKPEAGRSALDAMILAFQGIEFLREHVDSDVKIHFTILNSGGTPANIVPASTTASLYVRSYSRTYLDTVIERLSKVLRGAAMMTETEVRIMPEKEVDNKIPAIRLNRLIMDEAERVGAPRLAPPRENTGSTDFGNILHRIPGSCIRVAFVPDGVPSHSQGFVDAGKTPEAHSAIIYGAKILSGTAAELIMNPELLKEIKEEFKQRVVEEKK